MSYVRVLPFTQKGCVETVPELVVMVRTLPDTLHVPPPELDDEKVSVHEQDEDTFPEHDADVKNELCAWNIGPSEAQSLTPLKQLAGRTTDSVPVTVPPPEYVPSEAREIVPLTWGETLMDSFGHEGSDALPSSHSLVSFQLPTTLPPHAPGQLQVPPPPPDDEPLHATAPRATRTAPSIRVIMVSRGSSVRHARSCPRRSVPATLGMRRGASASSCRPRQWPPAGRTDPRPTLVRRPPAGRTERNVPSRLPRPSVSGSRDR